MKGRHVAVVLTCGIAVTSCVGDSSGADGAEDEALRDGSQIRCIAEEGVGLSNEDRRDRTGALSRMTLGDAFRGQYRVVDVETAATTPPMEGMVLFGQTLPRFEQIHFPPPVGEPSTTFLRTEPGVFLLFQLDPWENEVAGFSWVERRDGESFMAQGRCEVL